MESNTFSSLEIDAIGEMLNISLGSSATAVSNMLDKRVDITVPIVEMATREKFDFQYMEPAVGVEITYVKGLSGKNVMLLKREDVKVIVEILMGTTYSDEEFELDELTMSAVCEVMNQMMGASATALSEIINEVVDISTPITYEISTVDQFSEKYLLPDQEMVVVRFTLEIQDSVKSEFLNVISVEFARKLLTGSGMFEPPEAEEEEPAPPAPEPSSGGMMSQEDIEKMLAGGMGADPAPAPAPEPSGGGGMMSQEDIEKMLAGGLGADPAPAPAPAPAPVQQPMMQDPMMQQQMMQQPMMQQPMMQQPMMQQPMMQQPMMQQPMMQQPMMQRDPLMVNVRPAGFEELDNENKESIGLIMDVPLDVSVEIGRTKKHVKEILAYNEGSLIILDKLAGEQVDIYANGHQIAKGDVVVVDDCFGVRVTEVIKRYKQE
ncbi:MAG: flagellar motor switch protein FliN [Bacillota bacterium]